MAFNSNLLDGMVIFVEVVNEGSFTLAAKSTGHSTSYISKEVNKLEERLGVRLLNRTTRTLNLTPEGQSYYQQCLQIIQDAEQMENMLSGQQVVPKGRLKISCPVSFGLSRVRPIMAEFLARYPEIDLDVDLNDRKVDVVTDGFDVVIRASDKLEDSSLVSRKFMTSSGDTFVSPKYVEKHGMPIHPSELAEHKVLSYRYVNHKSWTYTAKNGQEVKVPLNNRVLTNSPELIIALCIAGEGVMRQPLFNLTDEVNTGKLIRLFPDYPMIEIGIYLVYPSRKYLSSKVRCFIDYIVEKLGDS